MQAAGPDLVTGYLPNQPLSDAAGQALRPMGPALMTHPPCDTGTQPFMDTEVQESCALAQGHTQCVICQPGRWQDWERC